MGEIDLFVIDEAYKLQESVVSNQRAYKLSETFLDSLANSSKKVFLLTPKAKLAEGFLGDSQIHKAYNWIENMSMNCIAPMKKPTLWTIVWAGMLVTNHNTFLFRL